MVIQVSQPMLPPHLRFATFYPKPSRADYRGFARWVGRAIAAFWASTGERNTHERKPTKRIAGRKERRTPLTIHGGGVPRVGKRWSQSVDVFLWRLLLSRGRRTRRPFSSPVSLCTSSSSKTICTHIRSCPYLLRWNFEALRSGSWPLAGPFGCPWAPGSVEATRAGPPAPVVSPVVSTLFKGTWASWPKRPGLIRQPRPLLVRCAAAMAGARYGATGASRRLGGAPFGARQIGLRLAQNVIHCSRCSAYVSILSFAPDVPHTTDQGTSQPALASMGVPSAREHVVPARFSGIQPSTYVVMYASFPVLRGKGAKVRHLATPLLCAFEK